MAAVADVVVAAIAAAAVLFVVAATATATAAAAVAIAAAATAFATTAIARRCHRPPLPPAAIATASAGNNAWGFDVNTDLGTAVTSSGAPCSAVRRDCMCLGQW